MTLGSVNVAERRGRPTADAEEVEKIDIPGKVIELVRGRLFFAAVIRLIRAVDPSEALTPSSD